MKSLLLATALMLFSSLATAQDSEINLLEKVAQSGNAAMQFILGLHYEVELQDYKKAVEWYTASAQQGDADSQLRLGKLYAAGKGVPRDYQKAINWLTKAAKQKDAEAQFNLGVLYQFGLGVPNDYHKVVSWWRKAAKQGYAKAQFNLGVLYSKGQFLARDYPEAKKWFEKAARQDIAEAQFNLGVMYNNGQGVRKNRVRALSFFYIIQAKGNEIARKNVVERKNAVERENIAEKEIIGENIFTDSKRGLAEKLTETAARTLVEAVAIFEQELSPKEIRKAKKWAKNFRRKYL